MHNRYNITIKLTKENRKMINFMNTLLPSHKNEQILLNNSLKDKKIIAIHAIKKDLFITFVKNTKLLALTSFTNIIHSLFDAVSFQVNSHNSENNSFFNSHNLLNKIIFDNPENKEILNTLINKTELMDNLTLICKHNNYQGLRKHLNYRRSLLHYKLCQAH